MTRRSRGVASFAPLRIIGRLVRNEVHLSDEFRRYLDQFRFRLENVFEPSGTIKASLSSIEPDGWLFLNGQVVSKAAYPDLFEAIGGGFGETDATFTLPDFRNRLPMGAGEKVKLLGTTGSDSITLTIDQIPAHNHEVVDPGHTHGAIDRGHEHGLHIDSHTHTVEEDGDNKHTHPVDDPGHTHTVNDPSHTHQGSVSQADNNGAAGSETSTASAGTSGSSTTGVSINQATTGISIDESDSDLSLTASEEELSGTVAPGKANIKVETAKTGISLKDTGGGKSINITPPVFGVNYLVKT